MYGDLDWTDLLNYRHYLLMSVGGSMIFLRLFAFPYSRVERARTRKTEERERGNV